MERDTRLALLAVLPLTVVVSMSVVPLTLVPVVHTVIAPLSHDAATDAGVSQLAEFLPGAIVVNPFSLLGRLVLLRAIVDVVWVCHGNPDGLHTQSGLVTWDYFREFMGLTPATRQYVMSCHSAGLLDRFPSLERTVPRSSVVGGVIDAGLLAGLTAMHIHLFHGDVDAARIVLMASLESTLERVCNNQVLPLGLGPNEIFWAAVGVAFLVISLLAGAGMGWALEEETIRAVGLMLAVGYLENLTNIVLLCIGWLSGAVSFLAFLASVLPIFPALLYYVIISVAWYNAWKAGVLVTSASTPWLTWLANIATALTVLALLLGILSDLQDNDDQATTLFG
ncbi:MAG: hypothetical protein HXY34_03135 [Candidatus Thorarchaeota archaeon]|nr:hypothetical protein [Candidatus Thorarchaeota archaeon]